MPDSRKHYFSKKKNSLNIYMSKSFLFRIFQQPCVFFTKFWQWLNTARTKKHWNKQWFVMIFPTLTTKLFLKKTVFFQNLFFGQSESSLFNINAPAIDTHVFAIFWFEFADFPKSLLLLWFSGSLQLLGEVNKTSITILFFLARNLLRYD